MATTKDELHMHGTKDKRYYVGGHMLSRTEDKLNVHAAKDKSQKTRGIMLEAMRCPEPMTNCMFMQRRTKARCPSPTAVSDAAAAPYNHV